MRNLFYCALVLAVLAACAVSEEKKGVVASDIAGVWKTKVISTTVLNGSGDTTRMNIGEDTDGICLYEVYREDGTFDYYVLRGDSVLRKSTYNYELRNDTIFASNDSVSANSHVLSVCDTALHQECVRVQNDTSYYMQSWSGRSELPAFLKK